MAYTCVDPEAEDGEVIGNGQCVAFVRQCTGAPQTSLWTPGVKVRNANVEFGTAIATFVNGVYPDNPTGQHAAIYVSQDANGITVWDQWSGQPVHKRVIRFRNGSGSLSNDGDAFSIIEATQNQPLNLIGTHLTDGIDLIRPSLTDEIDLPAIAPKCSSCKVDIMYGVGQQAHPDINIVYCLNCGHVLGIVPRHSYDLHDK